jgi:Tfp pilus assembly protein PilF
LANWDDAQRYMEESVAAEPNRIVHRLDLARVYAARGNRDRARATFEAAINGKVSDLNDKRYQQLAMEELSRL